MYRSPSKYPQATQNLKHAPQTSACVDERSGDVFYPDCRVYWRVAVTYSYPTITCTQRVTVVALSDCTADPVTDRHYILSDVKRH